MQNDQIVPRPADNDARRSTAYQRRFGYTMGAATISILFATPGLAQNETAPTATAGNRVQFDPSSAPRPNLTQPLISAEQVAHQRDVAISVHNRISEMGADFRNEQSEQQAEDAQLGDKQGVSRFIELVKLGRPGRAVREFPIVGSLGIFLIFSALVAILKSIFASRRKSS